MIPLFACATFLAAALLFAVQPLLARAVLPALGGSPAVWTACVLFFQTLLLAGYLYAHLLARWLGPRAQLAVHALVVAAPLALLPFPTAPAPPAAGASPLPWLLATLVALVAAPGLAVAASTPLLQRWFATAGHARSGDPYFLYVASNAGSLLALLAYPALLEPRTGLAAQARLWALGYGLFAIASVVCGAVMLRRRGAGATASPAPPPTDAAAGAALRPGRWMLLAAIPSSLTLGVTHHISMDIAAVPLLWVAPLALYLLSFVLAFAQPRATGAALGSTWLGASSALLLAAALAVAAVALPGTTDPRAIGLHLLALFAAGLVCHGRLADERPHARHLTAFYLLLALGGALGGAFNALVAPLLFDGIAEYPIALALACAFRPAARRERAGGAAGLAAALLPAALLFAVARAEPGAFAEASPWRYPLLVAAPAALLLLARHPRAFALGLAGLLAVSYVRPWERSEPVFSARTFFGVLRVRRVDAPQIGRSFMVFRHGTTYHGMQDLDPARAQVPLNYYHRRSPIGELFRVYRETPVTRRVALVGLGVGALATYARPGAQFRFYEIDPAVVRLAREHFSYLRDSPGEVEVVVGDARVSLSRECGPGYGTIVLDAFSSDAIPVHLLTREAVALYLRRLEPGGLLAFHVSNARVDLEPVLAAVAGELGLVAIARRDHTGLAAQMRGLFGSHWVVLARAEAQLTPLLERRGWRRLARGSARAWTDDRSSLWRALRW